MRVYQSPHRAWHQPVRHLELPRHSAVRQRQSGGGSPGLYCRRRGNPEAAQFNDGERAAAAGRDGADLCGHHRGESGALGAPPVPARVFWRAGVYHRPARRGGDRLRRGERSAGHGSGGSSRRGYPTRTIGSICLSRLARSRECRCGPVPRSPNPRRSSLVERGHQGWFLLRSAYRRC